MSLEILREVAEANHQAWWEATDEWFDEDLREGIPVTLWRSLEPDSL